MPVVVKCSMWSG